MILYYGCLALGLLLLVADVLGRFTASPERVRWGARIGIAAAGVAGLAPLLLWLTSPLREFFSWPFPLVAIGYLLLFLVFTAGVLGLSDDQASKRLRRSGYLTLLALTAIPSSLLLLAPFVALAGVALGRPTSPTA